MPKIQLPTTVTKEVTLDELDPATIALVRPDDLAVLRAEWFPREANAMGDGPEIRIGDKPAGTCGAALRDWAKRMAAKAGQDRVTVWQTPLPFLAALAVVIYGEAPRRPQPDGTWQRVWPEAWSSSDVVRALAWEAGKVPGAVSGRAIVMPSSRLAVTTATLS